MSYKVQYSAEARQDLRGILNYIAQELLVSDTDNYIIFYLLDEEKEVVSIVRIMYGGRDIS